MYKNCAFTGHRINLSGLDLELLDRVVLNLMKGGAKNFYCGMAQGFDLAAAESVLKYKDEYGAKLIACIPCANQTETFPEKSRQRYEKILERCDTQIILAPSYFSGCMYRRNRFLVDNCDVLVSYLRSHRGGTFYTVNYAKKNNVNIIEL
ncbi:MAG: DUF1273 domain-containing protein [Clostridia bacterium]|nr:DUF1273 domain-containing protein [Clostridia bacterium]